MSLFHRKPRIVTRYGSSAADGNPWRDRPAWMQEGVQPTTLVGNESLEVVGESFYQDNLRRLTGNRPPEEHVRSRKSTPYWWLNIL